MEGFYYIENSINEFSSAIIGYFTDLSSAKEALKECSDWYYPKGTGKIYYQPFGLIKETRPKLVYARGYENVG